MTIYTNGVSIHRDHKEEARQALGRFSADYRHIRPYAKGTAGKKLKKFTRGGFEFFLLETQYYSMGFDFELQGPFTEEKLYYQKK